MLENILPKKMKAIVLEDYNSNLMKALRNLRVIEKPIREVGNEEVVVKIDAAPCNPSDIAYIRGMYNIRKELPAIVGFEGTGTIIASGDDPLAKTLIGKRVSCFTQDNHDGTWGEYFVTKYNNCIEVNEKMELEQAACLAINPFTAYAIFKMAEERNSKAIIQNAAAGQIGICIRAFAKQAKIPVINIVRKEEHMNALRSGGEEYVLNLHEEGFAEALNYFAHKLNATTAFDAVGGELTGTIISTMPDNSQVILYGGLSGDPIRNIEALDIIFHNKSLIGFNLGEWIREISKEKFDQVSHELQEKIIKKEIFTKIQKNYSFDQVVRGLLQYIGHMSDGKILFKP